MTNPYYDHTTFPTPNAPGSSAQLRAELDLIEAGFDKLPTLAGNANNLVTVKADESGLESVSSVDNLTLNNPELNNAVLTGVPTTPTAATGTSSTQVASTAFVAATAFSSALPGQTGNAGKFVTTDGTTASWADPWTGAEFTASGSISLGASVALRTDGQVEAVAESAGTFVGSTVLFDTNAAYLSGAYHVAQDKYVFVYADGDNSNFGTAVVATQVGSVLTFGTPVVFRSATTAHLSAAYDSVNQKIVIAYQDGGNSSHGTAIVGTVSDTTITFGTAQVFNAASTAFCSVTFDASAGRPVIAYQNTPNQFGFVIVGTVSGTSITFGGAAVNLPASSTTSSYMAAVYDSTNSKTVIFYRDVGNTLLRGVVGTVSGATITLGSPEQLATNASWVSAAFVGSGKSVVAYQDASTNGAGVVASVSGTTLTFGTAANFIATTMAAATPAVVYDSASDRVVVQYSTATSIEVKVGTVSGTSISYGTASTVDAQSGGTVPYLAGTFNTTQGRVVFTFRQRNTTTTFGYVFSNKVTNAGAFAGFAQNAATNGQLVKVAIGGRVDSNRTGLVDGTLYYVNYNGTLASSNTGYALAGRAEGTTKILVNGTAKIPIDDYLPAQAGNANRVLKTNGSVASWADSGLVIGTAITGNTVLTATDNSARAVAMTALANCVTLPDATSLGNGREYFFKNTGNREFGVRANGGQLIATVKPGITARIVLMDNTTAAGTWGAYGEGLLQPLTVADYNWGSSYGSSSFHIEPWVVALTSTLSLHFVRDTSGFPYVYAVDCSTYPATIGTPALILTTSVRVNNCLAISSTKALVYVGSSNLYHVTVSGTTCTVSTALTTFSGDDIVRWQGWGTSVGRMGPGACVMGASNDRVLAVSGNAVALINVSGAAPTLVTSVDPRPSGYTGSSLTSYYIYRVSDTSAVIFMVANTGAPVLDFFVRVLSYSGSTITLGTESKINSATLATNGSASDIGVARLSATDYIVAWRSGGVTMKGISISGLNPTGTSESGVSSSGWQPDFFGASISRPNFYAVNSTTAVLSFPESSVSRFAYVAVSYNGSTLTIGNYLYGATFGTSTTAATYCQSSTGFISAFANATFTTLTSVNVSGTTLTVNGSGYWDAFGTAPSLSSNTVGIYLGWSISGGYGGFVNDGARQNQGRMCMFRYRANSPPQMLPDFALNNSAYGEATDGSRTIPAELAPNRVAFMTKTIYSSSVNYGTPKLQILEFPV